MHKTGTRKRPATATRRSQLEWQTVCSLYCELGYLFHFDEQEAAHSTVRLKLLLWQQISRVREHVVREALELAGTRTQRSRVQRIATLRELTLLDEAITKDGPQALQRVVARVRNIRLICALELLQELLREKAEPAAQHQQSRKATLALVRSCLLGVPEPMFRATFVHPEIADTRRRKGPFHAALAVIEAVGVLEGSTVKKILAKLQREFAMGERLEGRSPVPRRSDEPRVVVTDTEEP